LAVPRPREGVCGGAKVFDSVLRPARSVCVSLSAFSIDCCCQTKQDENGIIDSSELWSAALPATYLQT